MNLLAKTNALIKQNETNLARYLQNYKKQMAYDFYQDMKPAADEAKAKCESFLEVAIPWIKKVHPRHISVMQIEHLTENIQMTTVNAFDGKTYYKRFYEHYESSKYTLNLILACLEEK